MIKESSIKPIRHATEVDTRELYIRSMVVETSDLLNQDNSGAPDGYVDRLRDERDALVKVLATEYRVPTTELARLAGIHWTKVYAILDDAS